MSLELIGAVQTLFAVTPATDFYNGVAGQLYYGRVPKSAVYPYAAMFMIIKKPEDAQRGRIERAQFQINVYSSKEWIEETEGLLIKMETAFRNKQITPTNHSATIIRIESIFPSLPDGEEEQDPWRAGIEFWCRLERIN